MLVEITPAQLHYLHFLEMYKVKEEAREYVSQRGAYKRFGESNVDRWVKSLKVNQYKRPNMIEYNLKELQKAAATIQDYDF